jgi:hypothetical protein
MLTTINDRDQPDRDQRRRADHRRVAACERHRPSACRLDTGGEIDAD